jgi:predicted acetyltransferase
MTVTVRTLSQPEVLPALHLLERAFGSVPHPDDLEVELGVADPARTYGAFHGEDLVGTAGSFDFRMAVPGAVTPVAGVTWVGVLPTHRRQGVLNAMMDRQLADLHAEGKAVAALWATEAGIYGRYGYAVAAWSLALSLPRGAAFRAPVPAGGLRLVEPDAPELRAVYAEVARRTPGWPERDEAWWAHRLHDPEHRRHGASPLQCVLTDGGYALYATVASWDDALPAGVVKVREVVAATPEAEARLWRHLLDLDLVKEVQVFASAPDGLLVHGLLAEPRAARAAYRDTLHVRLVDVPAALAQRRYAADVDVVLAVDDPRCPWNTGSWRLVGSRDGASCTATSDAPDLLVAPSDLGAAYLGGTPLRARPVVERTPGALAGTSTAFGPVDVAPWCPQVF